MPDFNCPFCAWLNDWCDHAGSSRLLAHLETHHPILGVENRPPASTLVRVGAVVYCWCGEVMGELAWYDHVRESGGALEHVLASILQRGVDL